MPSELSGEDMLDLTLIKIIAPYVSVAYAYCRMVHGIA